MIDTMPLEMEYNTGRKIMAIPEYGRHIHKLIDYCKVEENREERTKIAQGIIDVMGNLQPHLRDVADFKHKLWDQLFVMANFELDVDSPFPIPTLESVRGKIKPLPYPKHASKYKYYGNNIETMMQTAISWEDVSMKEKLTYALANHMKKCYLIWNKDTVSDDIIKKHIEELSDNQLSIDIENKPLTESHILVKVQELASRNKSKKRK